MDALVNDFNSFFTEKISEIRKNIPIIPSITESTNINPKPVQKLTEFKPVTIEDIQLILNESGVKTSSNDPLPSFILEENMDFWLPIICDLVNTSITTGNIDGAKLAHLTPLIKGHSLDSSKRKNYRPISNLAFIGKLTERVVKEQLNEHLTVNNLQIPNQSGYKKYHSTETLLIRVVNDILIASDEGSATVVMLLDLSAAFDTVDHKKLLHILKHEIGIDGTALKWFSSFLCGRCQKVKIGEFESPEIIIKYGVPQGSVLGPILFNIYIRSLYATVHSLRFHVQGFADDHQIYRKFKPRNEHTILAHELPLVFQEIESWMALHYLLINAGKTEIIVFGCPSLLAQLQIHGCFINSSVCIRFVNTAKNLGFKLDCNLNFKCQINSLKTSCFNKLRKINKMHVHLSTKQIQSLVQGLVMSSLDYCNALYNGISKSQLHQLHIIQNRACRTILNLKQSDDVDLHLKDLHWLKIEQRIEFKILLLTFKALIGTAPSYIQDLISYINVSSSRYPSLKVPVCTSSHGQRAFSVSAPKLWNSLPHYIQQCDSVSSFKKKLKHYLFTRSHL